MKKLLILLFSILISFNSYGEDWEYIATSELGTKVYIDIDNIKEHDEYIYIMELSDYVKPSKYGDLSDIVYVEVDCKRSRYKFLYYTFYKKPMGVMETDSFPSSKLKWMYPASNTRGNKVLTWICDYVN